VNEDTSLTKAEKDSRKGNGSGKAPIEYTKVSNDKSNSTELIVQAPGSH
jgi:hypothetical protein